VHADEGGCALAQIEQGHRRKLPRSEYALSWPTYLMNAAALSTLFDSTEGLERLDVFEVRLRRDGPALVLRADLARFADHPARRWPAGANRVQIELEFLGVEALTLSGFSATNEGVLTVEPRPQGYSFDYEGTGFHAQGRCGGLRIATISAYIDTSLRPGVVPGGRGSGGRAR
jgi:hypothetical protein